VEIPAGEVWRLRPGTRILFRGGRWIVRGTLAAVGTRAAPVRIEGDGAFEGIDFRGGAGSSLEETVLAGGRYGARVTNAEVSFRAVRFEGNGVGLSVEPYAAVRVEGCDFIGPRRAGVLVKRGGAARIAKSRFAGAGRAGVYAYGAWDVAVADSVFEGNAVGLHAASGGAQAAAERCTLRRNDTGVLVEKTAAVRIASCRIEENEAGLRFSRRAEGTVSDSRIAGNGEGVIVEYSSYPIFRRNVFRANRRHAVLLRWQSAEWEEALGDTDRDPGEGAPFAGPPRGRGDFRPDVPGGAPGPPGRRKAVEGGVDFRGNDFGAPAAGGRPPGIHDAAEEPFFEYRGRRYRMDRVLLD